MRVVKPRVSYADLERMPEDGRRYELYDGEVFVVPSPIPLHQVVAQRLCWELEQYVRTHGGLAIMSPIDIVFSEYHAKSVCMSPLMMVVAPKRAKRPPESK